MSRACSKHGKRSNACGILVGKPEGKITTDINIKKDFGEIGWGGMDWNDLAQNRGEWRVLVNKIMNLRVP
jgi:hypothetical protein